MFENNYQLKTLTFQKVIKCNQLLYFYKVIKSYATYYILRVG